MRKYIAATLSIAVAIGPASALDVGVSGKVGGVGVSAGASVGSNGVSAGVGAGVGGIGGVSGGASARQRRRQRQCICRRRWRQRRCIGRRWWRQRRWIGWRRRQRARAPAGGTSAGSRSDASRSAAGSGSAGTGGIGTTVIRPAKGVRGSIILPPILRPSGARRDKTSRGDVGYPSSAIESYTGYANCRGPRLPERNRIRCGAAWRRARAGGKRRSCKPAAPRRPHRPNRGAHRLCTARRHSGPAGKGQMSPRRCRQSDRRDVKAAVVSPGRVTGTSAGPAGLGWMISTSFPGFGVPGSQRWIDALAGGNLERRAASPYAGLQALSRCT